MIYIHSSQCMHIGGDKFFLELFPKLILYINYDEVELKTTTHFGIFSKSVDEIEVVGKSEINLP